MKSVPYHKNTGGMACALACYTMCAQYLFPDKDITFQQLGRISNWREGYVVWGFPVWEWLMEKGVRITDIDVIDYEAWSSKGVEGLRQSVPEKEFEFYKEGTYDLEAVTREVQLVWNHRNFTYMHKKPTWNDVIGEFNKPGICDITLDSCRLNKRPGFSMHRVVLIDITDSEVVFHDPNEDGSGSYRREPLDFFKSCFESLDTPELARYSLS